MRLVNIDDCNRALFYKQLGGKDSLITVESAFNMLEALPTAYSIDKVVEELEEIRAKKTCNKEKCDTKEICRICVVDDAIEIVKQGGVSDDVCEWKQTSTARYRTSCGYKLEEYFDTKACYCKQCGKKIKAVE